MYAIKEILVAQLLLPFLVGIPSSVRFARFSRREWYHFGIMAFTLRLSPAEDAALIVLASSLGVSKQEAARQAILEKAARTVQTAELQELARRSVASYNALHGRVRRGR
ncbi:hypothetical protein CKALI_00065 [Corynebacterium kalinowskii]|uniref:Uncharacterized protein n=2 Tax=Corynebacterium kalinowskii TaxID=2675216 RepID=A0A6B8VN12_9CORY|nr:hypothetical protein CKALI_00065 [Corynebacterium kalinowskii]